MTEAKKETDMQAASSSNTQDQPSLIREDITADSELLNIFLDEARELDEQINHQFAQWQKNPEDLDILAVLQRYLHTIKGGARMAQINSIGDLTHEAETIYEYLIKGRIKPTMAWVDFMQDVQDTLSQQIDAIVATGQSFFASELVAQLQQLAQDRQLPDNFKPKSPTLDGNLLGLSTKDRKLNATTNRINPDRAVDVADPIDVLFDTAGQSDKEAQTLEKIMTNGGQRGIEFAFRRLKKHSWSEQTLPDTEIIDVFLEELAEINQRIRTDFEQLTSSFSDFDDSMTGSAIDERIYLKLQQDMHTIKGGARMIYASGMADMAYQLEMTYSNLIRHHIALTPSLAQLLLLANEWLESAEKLLQYGINPPEPLDIISTLQQSNRSSNKPIQLPDENLKDYLDAIEQFEDWKRTHIGQQDISQPPPIINSAQRLAEKNSLNNEMIRVSSTLMERMINLSGESAINRARIDMNVDSIGKTIEEMGRTVQRLADQLRRMDGELETQILSQIDDDALLDEGFDPLEMDQYSSINQLSKSLSESASDLLDIKTTILQKTHDAEDLLLQLSRTQTELQDGLMDSRMVPLERLWPRLQRVVRQTGSELNKPVELQVVNSDDEIDRTILEHITAPLEHMLRNAVDHGIETADVRQSAGKPAKGKIVLDVTRLGSELVIELSDDGRGIDVDAVRQKAISQGLIDENDETLTDLDVMQYIFSAGLTTTNKVTQISGRGVGMDVVLSEIRQLGGTVSVESTLGKGTVFSVRVPLTVSIANAMVVRVADKHYAIPLIQIERVVRVSPAALLEYYQSNQSTFSLGNEAYRLRYLNEMLAGASLGKTAANSVISLPVIIVKNQSGQKLALQVDEVMGSRLEVVVKPLGRQLSHIAGLSAATIMGDGSVMLILDILALHRHTPLRVLPQTATVNTRKQSIDKSLSDTLTVLVVDDSVTVRKVTTRLLERRGFETYVARDGVEALEILQEIEPDVMLLDIEMPRMDGFEVATHIRHNALLKELPIIMITSRTGDKHRKRAEEIGVNEYMGKPFQEKQLIATVCKVMGINDDTMATKEQVSDNTRKD